MVVRAQACKWERDHHGWKFKLVVVQRFVVFVGHQWIVGVASATSAASAATAASATWQLIAWAAVLRKPAVVDRPQWIVGLVFAT
jgi:hypothetical protein